MGHGASGLFEACRETRFSHGGQFFAAVNSNTIQVGSGSNGHGISPRNFPWDFQLGLGLTWGHPTGSFNGDLTQDLTHETEINGDFTRQWMELQGSYFVRTAGDFESTNGQIRSIFTTHRNTDVESNCWWHIPFPAIMACWKILHFDGFSQWNLHFNGLVGLV